MAARLTCSQWGPEGRHVGDFQEVSLEGDLPLPSLCPVLLVGEQRGQLALQQSHWGTSYMTARRERCRGPRGPQSQCGRLDCLCLLRERVLFKPLLFVAESYTTSTGCTVRTAMILATSSTKHSVSGLRNLRRGLLHSIV